MTLFNTPYFRLSPNGDLTATFRYEEPLYKRFEDVKEEDWENTPPARLLKTIINDLSIYNDIEYESSNQTSFAYDTMTKEEAESIKKDPQEGSLDTSSLNDKKAVSLYEELRSHYADFIEQELRSLGRRQAKLEQKVESKVADLYETIRELTEALEVSEKVEAVLEERIDFLIEQVITLENQKDNLEARLEALENPEHLYITADKVEPITASIDNIRITTAGMDDLNIETHADDYGESGTLSDTVAGGTLPYSEIDAHGWNLHEDGSAAFSAVEKDEQGPSTGGYSYIHPLLDNPAPSFGLSSEDSMRLLKIWANGPSEVCVLVPSLRKALEDKTQLGNLLEKAYILQYIDLQAKEDLRRSLNNRNSADLFGVYDRLEYVEEIDRVGAEWISHQGEVVVRVSKDSAAPCIAFLMYTLVSIARVIISSGKQEDMLK